MKAVMDKQGRIRLPRALKEQLGIQPGDEVQLEEQNGDWLLKAAKGSGGLQWKGNVLVHEGVSACSAENILQELREERNELQRQGNPTSHLRRR
jgi:AbrB family looped-hinge helix DNA binding protein